jgi:ABC-type sugar transport system ATPase subunit
VLFGLDKKDGGTITIRGKAVTSRRPRDGVRNGIAYVPEDRKADGIVPDLSIKDNIALPILGTLQTAGLIRVREELSLAAGYVKRLGISPADPVRRIDTLSGGNQQKAVLGKWLATKPTVLILDEPTRGVDVGAKADIHHIIGELAAQGVGILMISSELPEVLAVSDRIYVLHEGIISAEFQAAEATEESVMAAATGEVTA